MISVHAEMKAKGKNYNYLVLCLYFPENDESIFICSSKRKLECKKKKKKVGMWIILNRENLGFNSDESLEWLKLRKMSYKGRMKVLVGSQGLDCFLKYYRIVIRVLEPDDLLAQ